MVDDKQNTMRVERGLNDAADPVGWVFSCLWRIGLLYVMQNFLQLFTPATFELDNPYIPASPWVFLKPNGGKQSESEKQETSLFTGSFFSKGWDEVNETRRIQCDITDLRINQNCICKLTCLRFLLIKCERVEYMLYVPK